MRAWLNLRYTVPERRAAFKLGLEVCGYDVVYGLPNDIKKGDIFVTWNRIGAANVVAKRFESAKNTVIVAENATWGNGFLGRHWYTLGLNYHNTSGRYPVGSNARWDDLGVSLAPFRPLGEVVILPQRGIGSSPTVMPRDWPKLAAKRHGGRVRKHPGKLPGISLEDDLKKCGLAITWGSGAAIKALMMGIRVKSEMPNWIGEQDNTDAGRLAMFRRLAYAQWTIDEIKTGEPFSRLIK